MSLRIEIRHEIMQALIDEGYFQEEIANKLNYLVGEEIQRLDKMDQEAKEQKI